MSNGIPTEQIAFAGATVIPRAGAIHQPVVLMLDTSESMGWGQPPLKIDQLNTGVRAFTESWKDDELGEIIDVAIVTFDDEAYLHQGFQSAASLPPFQPLVAEGTTAMGAALNMSLDVIADYKTRLRTSGTEYHRPWIVCITDGEPSDRSVVQQAAQRLRSEEAVRGVVGYCMGVDGFNTGRAAEIFEKDNILSLKNYNFNAIFDFLRNSLVAVSQPHGGSEVQVSLPPDLTNTFTVHR